MSTASSSTNQNQKEEKEKEQKLRVVIGLPGDNFMVGNMVTFMVRVTITIRG